MSVSHFVFHSHFDFESLFMGCSYVLIEYYGPHCLFLANSKFTLVLMFVFLQKVCCTDEGILLAVCCFTCLL